jgi:peptidoglycan/LPS O-acetylase OafA/YrhL
MNDHVSNFKYRPDIDGLRAIAVMSVVLCHAGTQSISGGFIGVDIFFVISGFLITSIITTEIRQGSFTLVNFYERRIRRIFPALFVMLAFSSAIAYIIFMPKEIEGFGKSLIAATLSVSNIFFWTQVSYFDSSAELKPLLHTWSLGVEEQFYIFFPVFLIVVFRYLKQQVVTLILLVSLLSFFASLWAVEHETSKAFYLAHLRAWELAIGALLALGTIPVVEHRYNREIIALIGTGLMLWGLITFNSQTAFPGLSALIPCVGAALVIHAGSSGKSIVSSLLSWQPLVFIGLISYPLYLWHWPLLVFVKYYVIKPLTNLQVMATLLISLMAAIGTWHFIEKPFRKNGKKAARMTVFISAGISILIATLFGLAIVLSKGLPSRISDEALMLASGASDISEVTNTCMEKNRKWKKGDIHCYIGADNSAPSFIVLGDSHAGALMPGIDLSAKRLGTKGINAAVTGCPPLDGVIRMDGFSEGCAEFRNEMFVLIESTPAIKKVVLIARWAVNAEGTRYGKDDPGPSPVLIDEKNQNVGNHAVFSAGLLRTMDRLNKANKEIYIVLPVPEVGWNVPSVSARKLLSSNDIDIRPKTIDFHKRNMYISEVINKLVSDQKVTAIKPELALCHNGFCSIIIGGKSLYSDDDHLSVFGANYISGIFDAVFQVTKKNVSNANN